MKPIAPVILIALLLYACGDDQTPNTEVPSWARVAPEQMAEAKKHGAPVALQNGLGTKAAPSLAGRRSSLA